MYAEGSRNVRWVLGQSCKYCSLPIKSKPLLPIGSGKKLDTTSVKCIMLRYAEGQKAYHLWVPTQRKIIIAESVYFNEDTFLHDQPDNALPLTELNTEGHSLNHKEEVTPTQPQPNMGPAVGTDMTNLQSPSTPELPAPSPPNSPEIPPKHLPQYAHQHLRAAHRNPGENLNGIG